MHNFNLEMWFQLNFFEKLSGNLESDRLSSWTFALLGYDVNVFRVNVYYVNIGGAKGNWDSFYSNHYLSFLQYYENSNGDLYRNNSELWNHFRFQ